MTADPISSPSHALLTSCLAGEKPFQGNTLTALLLKIVNDQPPPMELEKWHLPQGIQAVLDRALAKDPNKRFGTGRELIDALASFLDPKKEEKAKRRDSAANRFSARTGMGRQ